MSKQIVALGMVILSSLGAAACADESGAEPRVVRGEGDSNDGPTAGGDGQVGGGQASSGYDEVAACVAPEPCGRSLAQLIENSMRHVDRANARCVLEGLRDRKPGRYLHDSDHTYSNGSIGADHALLLAADGTVRYARDNYGPGNETDPPARRCRLADASYFASCLESLDASPDTVADPAWRCLFGVGSNLEPGRLEWFTSCVTEVPRCE
jgi:hypothetical protein